MENGKSFIHFSYAYDQSSATRVATQSYLATFGRGKVGFTVVGKHPSGEPKSSAACWAWWNATRCATSWPWTPTRRRRTMEKRLALWYAATQKYPRQLNDLSEAEYLKFKRADLQRPSEARPGA